MSRERFDEDRIALRFGGQRININPNPNDRLRKAAVPVPGSAEFCLVSGLPLEAFIKHLRRCGVDIEFGPVETTGADGPIRPASFRDPDGNPTEAGISAQRRGWSGVFPPLP